MPNRKPNLIFIMTDQQRADTMAAYGNDVIQTPNLNTLAAESFVYERAYDSQPVCTPARSTIMTGLYPHTNGCVTNGTPLRTDTQTLAEMVSDDYRTAYMGKWHLGNELEPQHGFTEWVTTEDIYNRPDKRPEEAGRFSDYHRFLLANGFTPDQEKAGGNVFSRGAAAKLPAEYTKSSFLADEATKFIAENKDNPYVLYVSILEPHAPFTGTFDDMYDRENLNTGPTFLKPPPGNASIRHRLMASHYQHGGRQGLQTGEEATVRDIRARYWGLVTLVDQAVGRIMKALEESGQADNTIVVFTSDHGDMQGDHAIMAKGVLYDEAARVPLLMRVPWLMGEAADRRRANVAARHAVTGTASDQRAGRFVNGAVGQVDIVPTLLDLLGEPQPGHLEGKSLAPVLRGERTLADNDVVFEWNYDGKRPKTEESEFPPELVAKINALPWRTIVSGDGWKLNLASDDQCELYDLNDDPHETVNRFDDSAQEGRVRDMAARIRSWQRQVGDDAAVLPAGLQTLQ